MVTNLKLNTEEIYALDDLLDIYNSLHSKSVLVDWYFRGVDQIETMKLHEKIIRKIEKHFAPEHMQVNLLEGRQRLKRIPQEDRQ